MWIFILTPLLFLFLVVTLFIKVMSYNKVCDYSEKEYKIVQTNHYTTAYERKKGSNDEWAIAKFLFYRANKIGTFCKGISTIRWEEPFFCNLSKNKIEQIIEFQREINKNPTFEIDGDTYHQCIQLTNNADVYLVWINFKHYRSEKYDLSYFPRCSIEEIQRRHEEKKIKHLGTTYL